MTETAKEKHEAMRAIVSISMSDPIQVSAEIVQHALERVFRALYGRLSKMCRQPCNRLSRECVYFHWRLVGKLWMQTAKFCFKRSDIEIINCDSHFRPSPLLTHTPAPAPADAVVQVND